MKKILFITGTRADYGKLKSLIKILMVHPSFDVDIFVTGMHMLSLYGSTHLELEKDGFTKTYPFINQKTNDSMDIILATTIRGLSTYVHENPPDMIVVHGDRVEALAGALVGALNNIKVVHIEGGEVSGTIDESIRHAITKLAHIHCVANEQAAQRIRQLGEVPESIYIIGSPDIDVMLSDTIPSKEAAKARYNIPQDWDTWNIVMYHPVTTELAYLSENVQQLIRAILYTSDTEKYLVIYPNNDSGSDIILSAYRQHLEHANNIRIYPSIKFEYFLALLKHAKMVLGNSSAGIREAGVYGVPAIDIGSRQRGRYDKRRSVGIISTSEQADDITNAIDTAGTLRLERESVFGGGDSNVRFLDVLLSSRIWDSSIQKHFVDSH